ncbi:MAG: hypothetical protein V3W20_05915 [Candidatus Neomarinimicrobiota bacterium]|jgi:hypothetical protein
MEQPQQPVGRGPDPAEQPKRTDVNYSAGLDPDYNPGSGSSQGNPMEDALAIRGMFGAIHNELGALNANLVEQSSGLKARQINKEVMDRDIINLVGKPQTQQQQQIPQNQPQIQSQPGVQNVPPDPNQFEFNFDNSATAKDIFNRLFDIESTVNKILKLLEEKK